MKLFIVIDVQNEFVTGSLGTPEARSIIPKIKEAIIDARRKGYEIIYTRYTNGVNYPLTSEGKVLPITHCVSGTNGWEVVKDVDIPGSRHINKYQFGVSDWPASLCLDYIRIAGIKIDEITLCGLTTDICVITNVLNLRTIFSDIPIRVIKDCCAGTTPEAHEAAMMVMRSCLIDII